MKIENSAPSKPENVDSPAVDSSVKPEELPPPPPPPPPPPKPEPTLADMAAAQAARKKEQAAAKQPHADPKKAERGGAHHGAKPQLGSQSGAGKSTGTQRGEATQAIEEVTVFEAGAVGGTGSATSVNRAKNFLVEAVAAQGGVKPSDYLKAGMTAVGLIRDPKNMSAAETENLRNFAGALRGRLSDAGKKAFGQATMLAKAIDPYFAAQSNQDIANGLVKRVEYQMGRLSPPPFNMANFDYALLGQGTDASAEIAVAIVSSLGRAAGGGGGSSDQVVQTFTPKREIRSLSAGRVRRKRVTNKPLEPAQQAFVSNWVSRNGDITAGNKDRLQHDLEQKFGGSFAMEQGVKSWAGQSQNAQALADNDKVAYTQWNADNTPKVYGSNHLAEGLINQLKQNAQQFPDAVRSLNRDDVIALMERLEKEYDPGSNEANRITGMLGYQKLSQLRGHEKIWEDYPAIATEQRGGIINAARVMNESPHLVANLGEVTGPGQVLIKPDHYGLYLERSGAVPVALTGQVSRDPLKTKYVQAVRTLFSEDGWAALEYFEGADTNMNNKVVGGRGLNRLSQAGNDRPITGPDDPRWGAGNLEQLRPEIKISPERRAELIQAAKIVNGHPALRAQVLNSSRLFTADSVANFLNTNPVLLNPASTAQGLASDPARYLNSLAVARNKLSTGASIGLDLFTLGLGSLIHDAANPPKFSQTQNEAREALTYFGRPTDVLDKAMSDARGAWKDDLITNALMAGAGLATIFVGGPATAAGIRSASSVAGILGKVLGQSAGQAIANRVLVPIVENIVDPVGLAGLAGVARAGGNALLRGVRAAVQRFGQGTEAAPALGKLVVAAANGQDLGAPLAHAINTVSVMPRTAESARVLKQLEKSHANWQESKRVAAKLGAGPSAPGVSPAALQSAGGVAQSRPGATLTDGRFVPEGGSIPRYPKSTTEWIYNDGGKLKNLVQYAGGDLSGPQKWLGTIGGTTFITDSYKLGDNTVRRVLYKSEKDGKYYDTPPAQLRDSDVVWNDASKQRGKLLVNDSSSEGWSTVDVVRAGNGKPIAGKLGADGVFVQAKPESLSPKALSDGQFDNANRYYPWGGGTYRKDEPAGLKPEPKAVPAQPRPQLDKGQVGRDNVEIGGKKYDIRRDAKGRELPPGQAEGTRFGFKNAEGQQRVYYQDPKTKLYSPDYPRPIREGDVNFTPGGNGAGVVYRNPEDPSQALEKVPVIRTRKDEIWEVASQKGDVVTAKRGGETRQFKPGKGGYEIVQAAGTKAVPAQPRPQLDKGSGGASGSGGARPATKSGEVYQPAKMPDLAGVRGVTSKGDAIVASGIPKAYALAIKQVAKDNNTPILIRPVNQDSTSLLAASAAAKPMEVKGKSSDWGPMKGYIPFDTELSKTRKATSGHDNPNEQSLKDHPSVVVATPLVMDRGVFFARVDEAKKAAGGKYEDDILTIPVKDKDGKATNRVAQFKARFDAKTNEGVVSYRVFDKGDKKPGEFEPLKVMAKPTPGDSHRPYTADLDVWSMNPPISNIARQPTMDGETANSLLASLTDPDSGIKVNGNGQVKTFTVEQYDKSKVDYRMTQQKNGKWKIEYKQPDKSDYIDLPIPYHGPEGQKAIYPKITPGEFTVNSLRYVTHERIYNPPRELGEGASAFQKAVWNVANQTGVSGAKRSYDDMMGSGGPGAAGVGTGFDLYMRAEMNAAVKGAGYRGGDVVLHGPETDNLKFFDQDTGVSIAAPNGFFYADGWNAVKEAHSAIRGAGYVAPVNPVYDKAPGEKFTHFGKTQTVPEGRPIPQWDKGKGPGSATPAAKPAAGGVEWRSELGLMIVKPGADVEVLGRAGRGYKDVFNIKIKFGEETKKYEAVKLTGQGDTYTIGAPFGKDMFQATKLNGEKLGSLYRGEDGTYFQGGLKGGAPNRAGGGGGPVPLPSQDVVPSGSGAATSRESRPASNASDRQTSAKGGEKKGNDGYTPVSTRQRYDLGGGYTLDKTVKPPTIKVKEVLVDTSSYLPFELNKVTRYKEIKDGVIEVKLSDGNSKKIIIVQAGGDKGVVGNLMFNNTEGKKVYAFSGELNEKGHFVAVEKTKGLPIGEYKLEGERWIRLTSAAPKADKTEMVELENINFSQATVNSVKLENGSPKKHNFIDSMVAYKQGEQERLPALVLDVVEMPSGQLVTMDNTRLAAAKLYEQIATRAGSGLEKGKGKVRVRIHEFNEKLTEADKDRFAGERSGKVQLPVTWGEAISFRVAKQSQSNGFKPSSIVRDPVGGLPIIKPGKDNSIERELDNSNTLKEAVKSGDQNAIKLVRALGSNLKIKNGIEAVGN